MVWIERVGRGSGCKCQLSVKIVSICQLLDAFWPFVICQELNPLQGQLTLNQKFLKSRNGGKW